MASLKVFLDKRYKRQDGLFPLKVNVSLSRDTGFVLSTKIYLEPKQWNGSKIINHDNRLFLDSDLSRKVSAAKDILLSLELSGSISRKTPKEIQSAIESAWGRSGNSAYSVNDHFRKVIDSKTRQSTKDICQQTLIKIQLFRESPVLFEDITYSWLKEFEKFLLGSGIKINSAAIHMRNLRAVINDAINEDIAPLSCYAFRKFKIKKEDTRKRALTIGQLRLLRDYGCEPTQRQYRDIFILIFYLGGINIIDLCNLKKITADGYIEYRRSKTGRLYKIKVEPEAMEIIERYWGKNYLLNILDRHKDYTNYRHRLNDNLKSIGPSKIVKDKAGKLRKIERSPLFPDLSTYWARHSWASIAASLDIPKETIAAVLGHANNSVTDVYISFDQRKIDNAIKDVIRYVNSKEGD